LLLPLQQI